jgi:voltage-gated potassium channel
MIYPSGRRPNREAGTGIRSVPEVFRIPERTRCTANPAGYCPLRARLVVMNDMAQQPGDGAGSDVGGDDPSGRLAAYRARTEVPLDLLALVTLWFVLVPPGYFHHVQHVWWTLRIALSVVYAIDLTNRGVLAGDLVRYARTNPLLLASVLFPPVRVIFSFRLIRAMFRRGQLPRFLLAAALLVLDGAIMVYLFERDAPHSSIHTLGESVWWALVTVTTVGYGDYTPVTVYGRITAIFIMFTGLLTLAVVTAQVASSFVAQGSSRAQRRAQAEAAPPGVTLAELDLRLARIEALLIAAVPSAQPAAEEREPGSERP